MPIYFIVFLLSQLWSQLTRTVFMPVPIPLLDFLDRPDWTFKGCCILHDIYRLYEGYLFPDLQKMVKFVYKLFAKIVHFIFLYLHNTENTC